MKKILLVLLLAVVFAFSGCGSNSSPNCTFSGLTPYAGYLIFYTSNGTQTAITRYANGSGTITAYLYGASCNSAAVVAIINSGYTLTANPSSIDLTNPPSTVTISGQGFDTTYGMPRVEYFDSNGFLLGSVYATSVSGGGTSLVANVPNLSAAYSGTYQIRVTNKTYLGYYNHIVGVATVTAFGRDRLDSDGDGYYDDQDCYPDDPGLWDCSGGTCGGYGNVPRELCEPL